MIYAVDLDHTLCFPNLKEKNTYLRYGEALPNLPLIEKINSLYEKGDTIILYTARRMLTHKGDLQKIEEDVGDITRDWLRQHKVKYHELIFGKIYYDLLIDDKTILPEDFLNS